MFLRPPRSARPRASPVLSALLIGQRPVAARLHIDKPGYTVVLRRLLVFVALVGAVAPVDKAGRTVDGLLTAKRDHTAVSRFRRKAIDQCGVPQRVEPIPQL